MKSKELFKHPKIFCIISLVRNSSGKPFIFSVICDCNFIPLESIIIHINSISLFLISTVFSERIIPCSLQSVIKISKCFS